jgi:hypothetical protein
MTTKEEVMILAAEAGLETYINGDIFVKDKRNSPIQEIITKLIELAKAQGAAEERTLSYEREKEIVRLACLAAADQAREHQQEIEAIRNRERK